MADIDQVKHSARSQAIARRDAMPRELREQKSDRICSQLKAILDRLLAKVPDANRPPMSSVRRPSATVAVYATMRSEADPSAFARYAEERGCVVAYPCMLDPRESAARAQRMCMRAARQQDLDAAPFIAHPARPFASDAIDSSLFPIVPAREIDLIVVPIVAFDEHNLRLGYGGGCYDRYLPTLRPGCQIVGIAFDEQRLAAVPASPHDQALQRILHA